MNKMIPSLVFLLVFLVTSSVAFLPHPLPRQSSRSSSSLFGLAEWRDNVRVEQDVGHKPILLLPFAASEALVQGQSMSIILKEGRFYDLFQDCIDDYESIIGMVLMGDDGLLKDMPLCEIHDFEVQAGFRGKVTVSVTLRAVGRAKVHEFTQMKPIMMAVCNELADDGNADIALASELLDDIEATISDMNVVDLQTRYDKAFELAVETDSQGYVTSSETSTDESNTRTLSELTAKSWAVFGCITDKSSLYKAIASTNLIERLELGLKSLLDEKYQASAISTERDGDVGFQ